jgi:hypothetical protein
MLARALLLFPFLLLACNKAKPETTEPPSTDPPPATTDASTDEPPPASDETERPSITTADCEAKGGKVVGDIGDGAIHRPDYVCPDTGNPPIGSIAADPAGPTAVEGAVCCG